MVMPKKIDTPHMPLRSMTRYPIMLGRKMVSGIWMVSKWGSGTDIRIPMGGGGEKFHSENISVYLLPPKKDNNAAAI